MLVEGFAWTVTEFDGSTRATDQMRGKH